MKMVTEGVQRAFDQAKKIVFLTGAGVSTLSGIPDYRSKNGVYQGLDYSPEYLLSDQAFAEIPDIQYDFMQQNLYFPKAQPNVIHQKMAEFVTEGRAKVITQNIDDLDVKAGLSDQQLIRFHGSLYDLYSPKDGQKARLEDYQCSLYRPEDGAKIRPRITFYGEIPFRVEEAVTWVAQADLICLVGTSFKVYPFAGLLSYAQPNVPIFAVNLTPLPAMAGVQQIIGNAADFFGELKN
ncbi:Sir2 family NAD-dependent protein deacetylase [Fructobacillus fructosus]|uniref:Sir2 family NAD-dependent protein deacetylase n=1 Tax=Fructobacillus fructosus TaxID=1631 RepID=UPI002DACD3D9|nr:NAD-dependent protein deacetylase [Fructobacillus fructosus]CAK1241399.1 NAD-dependent protein deacetylase [Fructobacillus fructosus]CAK1242958.1 NAD-dependent protein deacetylase [Fructobacillus fructosus]